MECLVACIPHLVFGLSREKETKLTQTKEEETKLGRDQTPMSNQYTVLSVDDTEEAEVLPTIVVEAPIPQLTFPPGMRFPKDCKKKLRFAFLSKDPHRTTYHTLKEEPHVVS